MPVINRDLDQQKNAAAQLKDDAKTLRDDIAVLKRLLDGMKQSAVFDDTSQGAVDTISKMVDSLEEPAQKAVEMAGKIESHVAQEEESLKILDRLP